MTLDFPKWLSPFSKLSAGSKYKIRLEITSMKWTIHMELISSVKSSWIKLIFKSLVKKMYWFFFLLKFAKVYAVNTFSILLQFMINVKNGMKCEKTFVCNICLEAFKVGTYNDIKYFCSIDKGKNITESKHNVVRIPYSKLPYFLPLLCRSEAIIFILLYFS